DDVPGRLRPLDARRDGPRLPRRQWGPLRSRDPSRRRLLPRRPGRALAPHPRPHRHHEPPPPHLPLTPPEMEEWCLAPFLPPPVRSTRARAGRRARAAAPDPREGNDLRRVPPAPGEEWCLAPFLRDRLVGTLRPVGGRMDGSLARAALRPRAR